jgi:hypothetical protein
LDDDLTNGCECRADQVERVWVDCDGDEHPGGLAENVSMQQSPRTIQYCADADAAGPEASASEVCGTGGQWVQRSPAEDGWADCNDDDDSIYEGYPTEASPFDEGWLCDGADNDCDGSADEICCTGDMGEGFDFSAGGFRVGSGRLLRLAKPAETAPDKAVAVAAWATPDGLLKFVHLGPDGGVLQSTDVSLNDGSQFFRRSDVRRLELVSVGSGYLAMVALDAELKEGLISEIDDDNKARIFSVSVSGDFSQSSLNDAPLHEANAIGGIEAVGSAEQGVVSAIVGTRSVPGVNFAVRVCQFDVDRPTDCQFRQTISVPTAELEDPVYPELTAMERGFVAGWWDEAEGVKLFKLKQSFSDGRKAWEIRKDVDVEINSNTSVPIDLVTRRVDRGGFVDVLYPVFNGLQNRSQLRLLRVSFEDFSVADEFVLADSSQAFGHREPNAIYLPESDELMVTWRRVDYDRQQNGISFARLDAASPSSGTTQVLRPDGLGAHRDGGIVFEKLDRGAGVAWVNTKVQPVAQARYLSSGGNPVCAN